MWFISKPRLHKKFNVLGVFLFYYYYYLLISGCFRNKKLDPRLTLMETEKGISEHRVKNKRMCNHASSAAENDSGTFCTVHDVTSERTIVQNY